MTNLHFIGVISNNTRICCDAACRARQKLKQALEAPLPPEVQATSPDSFSMDDQGQSTADPATRRNKDIEALKILLEESENTNGIVEEDCQTPLAT